MLAAALLAAALGAVQLGSDSIFASAATPYSLPAHLPADTGVTVYRVIERVAPAPYVNLMLARAELDRGDVVRAHAHALRLPPSVRRSDLLGRIAQARGDQREAVRDFIAAGDVFAIDDEVDLIAKRDLRAAYALELILKNRLERTSTHPDSLAESLWHLGALASWLGESSTAMSDFASAVSLSPLTEKYLLGAGFQAYQMRRYPEARSYFARAISVDPLSADAYAGAGLVALRVGDRSAAQAYARRGRATHRRSHVLQSLEQQLQ